MKALSVACFGRTIAITHSHAQIRLCALVPRIDLKTIHVVMLRLRWRSDGEVWICGASIYIDGSCAALWQPLQWLPIAIGSITHGHAQYQTAGKAHAIHVDPREWTSFCAPVSPYTPA